MTNPKAHYPAPKPARLETEAETPLHSRLVAKYTAARVAADCETRAASADPLRRAALLQEAARLREVTW